MDLLRLEIERKRKAAALEPSGGQQQAKRQKVYKTRKELEEERLAEEQRQREQELQAQQQQQQQQQQEQQAQHLPREAEGLASSTGSDTADGSSSAAQARTTLPVDEVKRRLRAFDEVVTFFGESDLDRERRYAAAAGQCQQQQQ